MSSSVHVVGVGMIPFVKPGANRQYPEMAVAALRIALADAGVGYGSIEQAYVGYVYGDSTCGQRALYEVGMSGVPIVSESCAISAGSDWTRSGILFAPYDGLVDACRTLLRSPEDRELRTQKSLGGLGLVIRGY